MPGLMLVRVMLAVVVLGFGAGSAVAGAGADAIAFVRSLYMVDDYWNGITTDQGKAHKYLDDRLAELILDNYASENVNATLTYDPLLQAQDWDSISIDVSLKQIDDKTAAVNVVVKNLGEPTFLILDLVLTPGGWRLADIHSSEGSSLVEELETLNAQS
jgi:hypothetical protein